MKTTNRHRAREIAFQILYRYDLEAHATGLPLPKAYALEQDLKKHFEHFQVQDSLRDFSADLVRGTLANLESLDRTIEECSPKWKISRMPFVDRNLIRMSTYEMLNHTDIPVSVTIDEAIEIAKLFGTEESGAFVNGLLDALAKKLRGEKE